MGSHIIIILVLALVCISNSAIVAAGFWVVTFQIRINYPDKCWGDSPFRPFPPAPFKIYNVAGRSSKKKYKETSKGLFIIKIHHMFL
jgi:hypothetical protein|tara:strand:+ start:32619 stop:32879 length:261 start_codon:yes stop_codon:yes gene_type:complete